MRVSHLERSLIGKKFLLIIHFKEKTAKNKTEKPLIASSEIPTQLKVTVRRWRVTGGIEELGIFLLARERISYE